MTASSSNLTQTPVVSHIYLENNCRMSGTGTHLETGLDTPTLPSSHICELGQNFKNLIACASLQASGTHTSPLLV